MYWDNARIGDVLFSNSAARERRFLDIQRDYINDELFIINAVWALNDAAFRKDGEYRKPVQILIGDLDEAVWDANNTVDSYMEVDEDYLLSFIDEDTTFRIVGMTTDKGVEIIDSVLRKCGKYGVASIQIK